MIEWKEQKSDISISEWDSFDVSKLAITKDKMESFIQKGFRIFFLKEEWDRMFAYGRTSENELGGLLLGYVFFYKQNYIRILDQMIWNEDYIHSTSHLILYPSLWQKANQYLFDPHGNLIKLIVGWFHTHPKFLPVFSSVDRKTHQSFFDFPFSIGIVFDPFSKEYAIYETKDSLLYTKPIIFIPES